MIDEQKPPLIIQLALPLSFLFPIIGLILAIIGLIQIKKNPSIAGKKIAIISLIIASFLIVVIGGALLYFILG